MSNELSCTWEDLQKRGKEFIDFLPTCSDIRELDSAWKMVALSYLNMQRDDGINTYQAEILLKILGKEFFNKEYDLQNSVL